jgi:hypothetical protein
MGDGRKATADGGNGLIQLIWLGVIAHASSCTEPAARTKWRQLCARWR